MVDSSPSTHSLHCKTRSSSSPRLQTAANRHSHFPPSSSLPPLSLSHSLPVSVFSFLLFLIPSPTFNPPLFLPPVLHGLLSLTRSRPGDSFPLGLILSLCLSSPGFFHFHFHSDPILYRLLPRTTTTPFSGTSVEQKKGLNK